jgi:hypothetical protein
MRRKTPLSIKTDTQHCAAGKPLSENFESMDATQLHITHWIPARQYEDILVTLREPMCRPVLNAMRSICRLDPVCNSSLIRSTRIRILARLSSSLSRHPGVGGTERFPCCHSSYLCRTFAQCADHDHTLPESKIIQTSTKIV